jgi:hypothetical protein
VIGDIPKLDIVRIQGSIVGMGIVETGDHQLACSVDDLGGALFDVGPYCPV